MNENELAQAILLGELKTLQSVAKRFPRQDGSGIGVNSGTAWQWIERGNLKLPQVLIDGERFFYVSAADQLRPDWNLQQKLVKRHRRGRPTDAEYLGFGPKG
jgi:hypothetical protein